MCIRDSTIIAQFNEGLVTKAARDLYGSNFISVTSERFRELVQGICDGNYLNSLDIAQSCDMTLKGTGGKSAQEWTVKNGSLSGDIELTGRCKEFKTVAHGY